jgi:hypothetical protein
MAYGNQKPGLLAGLSKKGGPAGAAAYGQAMAGMAGLNMDKAEKSQALGMQAMKQDGAFQRQGSQLNAQQTQNRMQEATQSEGMGSRERAFRTQHDARMGAMGQQKINRRRQMALDLFTRML